MSEAQYYETRDLWSESRFQLDQERRRFAAAASLLPVSVANLLDVGAGNGAFLRYLEDEGSALHLLGLERARTAIDLKVCRADIQPGSADTLPFDDRSFDAVSALEVIEHLPYGVYERSLRELERVAGHYILISVPYREPRHRVICPYCGCQFHPYYHMRRFDDAVMPRLFETFELVRRLEVGVEEYVVMPLVRAARGLLRRRVYPTSAICPQCGYTQADSAAPVVTPPPASSAKRLARFIPRYTRRNWIITLYQRRTG